MVVDLPGSRTALGEVEDLARVEEVLELLHELGALIAARFGIDEDDERLDDGRRDRLDDETALLLVGFVALAARRALLLFGAARRLAQARLEALLGRQFHDPRRRHHHARVRP